MSQQIALKEKKRLAVLAEYQVLDTPPEDCFDDLTALAAQICEAPIALITIVEKDRQWFKSRIGVDVEETGREISICSHALLERDLFVIKDTLKDPRFWTNPLVIGQPFLRFYAGAPLVNDDGYALGTLCVLDAVPRDLTGSQRRALRILSRLVITQLELRRSDLRRRETEEELRKSHAELRECVQANERQIAAARLDAESTRKEIVDVMERVSDGIVAMDADWRYTYLNPTSAQVLGRSAEDLLGKCAWVEFPNAVGGPFYLACQRAVREQRVVDHQEYFPRLDRWLEGRIYPSEKGVSLVYQDVTERKAREKDLEDVNSQLQLALRSSNIGLWDWDLIADRVTYSPEWKAQLGYSNAEIANTYKEWQSRLHPEDTRRILGYLRAYLAQPTSEFQHECRLRHKDGSYRVIYTRARCYRDEDSGKPVRMLGCHIDVTDRKAIEQSLVESREQLRALAVHLQSVREEEATRIARELHDEMGAALTGLKMDLFWIARQFAQPFEPDRQGAIVARIESTMELVDATIENVRKVCRELRPAVLDELGLATAIEWQASEFQERTAIECQVSQRLIVPVEPAPATAIFRIFQEVLTNVARHAEASKVWILLEHRSDALVLEVRDNGRGMMEERAENHLGLVGMRERAFAAGGKLEIISTPGKGTTVSVQIPIEPAVHGGPES